MDRLGREYLKKQPLRGPYTSSMIGYLERSLIPEARFKDTYAKVMKLFTSTQMPILEYDGSKLTQTLDALTVNLTLFDCSAIALMYEDRTKPGHMVCAVRQVGPQGPYVEYFDSEGTPLDAYGTPDELRSSDGIGNPNALITGLIDRGNFVEQYRPPQQYLRTANGLQISEHKTCSLQTLFRLMNRNLPARKYYEWLFHNAGTAYDAYMIQAIEDVSQARTKVVEGQSATIPWLQEVIPYEDLRKAYISPSKIREIRFKEAQSRGGQEWLASQLEADELGAIEYAKWTKDQSNLNLMLFNEELVSGQDAQEAIDRAERATKRAEEAAQTLSTLGYADVEEIMESVRAERQGETITPPDVEEFTPEEQERIRQRASELRAMIGSPETGPDSEEVFRRRVDELRRLLPQ